MATQNRSLRRAVQRALLASAAGATVVALPTQAADQTIQEVVVTGSRIAQPNLETTSPVTQVTSEDVLSQGVTKIEDLINQLPQAFAAQNGTVSNGATGTATVNLRGLGANQQRQSRRFASRKYRERPIVSRLLADLQRLPSFGETPEIGSGVEADDEIASGGKHLGHVRGKVHPTAVAARDDNRFAAAHAVEI